MEHKTPLAVHFKDKHIWFDLAILSALFMASTFIPLLKIVALVACLEIFSFFSLHLLARGRRFQLQGFLGGFISSTTVFLQILNDKKYASLSEREVLLTLLFATCAMLFECLFIEYFIAQELPLVFYLPFSVQLILLMLVIMYVSKKYPPVVDKNDAASSFASEIEIMIDHPIIWKNVAKLSLLIFAIVSIMNFVGSEFGFSRNLSALIISFFEAHAILASVMMEWSLQSKNINLMHLLYLILLGNTISKSYLAFRGKNLKRKRFFIVAMFGSFLGSVACSWLYLML
jgi:uncharacterized membrane protein (DUF4010 family)